MTYGEGDVSLSDPRLSAMKRYFTISRSIILFGIVTAISLSAVIGTSLYSLSQLKVGGPLYNRIISGKDLVADILPPPAYVIEAYLEASLALHYPANAAKHRTRIAQLKKEYEERREFWAKSDLDAPLKAKLTEQSHREVEKFWATAEKDLWPALEKGDTAAATKAYAALSTVYAAHRAIIDDVVKITNDANTVTETGATQRVDNMTMLLWAISALVFLIIGAGIVGVGIGVIKPIMSMTRSMKQLADGDLECTIPGANRSDEVGAMASAVQVFKDNMVRAKELAANEAAAVAERVKRAARVDELAQNFDTSVSAILDSFTTASGELETTLVSMKSMAEQTASQAAEVASVAQETSSNVQTVAAASEELASSVTEIGRQVGQSEKVAQNAVDEAGRTNTTIQGLFSQASTIGDVIKLINEIASQTNLLALNATIEAARAGDAGKGFAVVASEVKSLAEQTARATEQISAQIASIQTSSTDAVTAVQSISGIIGEINSIASAITASVQEQSTATQEIARNIQRASVGTNGISENIAGVQSIAGNTGAATEQVIAASRELAEQSDAMRARVASFLADIKAA